jgi:hypothetical protein
VTINRVGWKAKSFEQQPVLSYRRSEIGARAEDSPATIC